MSVEFFMPKVTDNMDSGVLLSWLVKEGERVEKGQPILEIETDKATVELEAPASGILTGIREGMTKGATVPVGETIAYIAEAEELTVTPSPAGLSGQPHPESQPIRGAGQQAAPQEQAHLGASPSGAGDQWLELPPAQLVTGKRLTESVRNIPHFSLTVDVDMDALVNLKAVMKLDPAVVGGDTPSLTALLVKILAVTLRKNPRFNSSFEGPKLKLHGSVNVGVAVGTQAGLVVPVIRNADKKSVAQITADLGEFRLKADAMRFSLEDLAEGTFTISNLGMFGVDEFVAIINPPQAAILAVGQVTNKPTAGVDGAIVLRPIARLTLSLDHRALDGMAGARFLSDLKDRIEHPKLDD